MIGNQDLCPIYKAYPCVNQVIPLKFDFYARKVEKKFYLSSFKFRRLKGIDCDKWYEIFPKPNNTNATIIFDALMII